FKDSRISSLRFAANDARRFADTLKTECSFDHVRTLVNESATTSNIKNEIDDLAKMADPEDLVVVYFASHGSPEENDKAGINYIVTYDTNLDKLYGTAFEMDDLLNDVRKRIPAARVVAFLDTCYSGGTFKDLPSGWTSSRGLVVKPFGLQSDSIERDLRGDSRAVKIKPAASTDSRKPQGVGRVIIAASRQNEQSYEFAEDKRIQHGYFTYFLIEIVRQNRRISVEALFALLREKVPEAVKRDTSGKEQHPTMVKSIDGVAEIYLREEPKVGQPQSKEKR
ncbi:MAG: caspase family protein, partial [Blastocatellia bacterium]